MLSLTLRPLVTSRAHFIGCGIRAMTSTHIEKTAGSSRDTVFSRVQVTDISKLSPTVKEYTLQVYNRNLRFLAGQWVDLHIPNEDIIGGYSIISPPHQLDGEDSVIKLAIKNNDHPPTLWMTTKCAVGDELTIRIGGDFYYSPKNEINIEGDLLLIGGGVGINPLFSILSHHARLLHVSPLVLGKGRSVQLMYSSKTESELLFKDQIEELSSNTDKVKVQYFVTSPLPNSPKESNLKYRRITTPDVVEVLRGLNSEGVQCYLCGPPPMTEAMMETLVRHCGISTNQIHYEKWW